MTTLERLAFRVDFMQHFGVDPYSTQAAQHVGAFVDRQARMLKYLNDPQMNAPYTLKLRTRESGA